MGKLNNFIELYECVHIEHIDDYSEIEIWGLTNRKSVVPNEHTKIITYIEELNSIKIQDAMHGSVIDEYGQMIFDQIDPDKIEVCPSMGWENGMVIIFHHTYGGNGAGYQIINKWFLCFIMIYQKITFGMKLKLVKPIKVVIIIMLLIHKNLIQSTKLVNIGMG